MPDATSQRNSTSHPGSRPDLPALHADASRAAGESGVALLLFAVALLLLIVVGSLSQAYRPGPLGTALTEVLAILLPALIFSRARRAHALHALRLLPISRRVLWALLGGVLLGLAWFYLLAGWIEPVWERWFPVPEAERQHMLRMLRPPSGLRPLWQDLLCFAAVPAICEEVLFRGALLPLLTPALDPMLRRAGYARVAAVAPVLACAVLFGIFHLSLPKFFPTTLLGIGFGVARVWSHSLWAAIAMHCTNNAMVIVLTRAGLDDGPAAGSELSLGTSLGLLFGALVLGALGVRVLRYAARRLRSSSRSVDAA